MGKGIGRKKLDAREKKIRLALDKCRDSSLLGNIGKVMTDYFPFDFDIEERIKNER
mgnify:CR=1 FL=1